MSALLKMAMCPAPFQGSGKKKPRPQQTRDQKIPPKGSKPPPLIQPSFLATESAPQFEIARDPRIHGSPRSSSSGGSPHQIPRTPVSSQPGSTGSNSSGGSRSTHTSGYQSESQTGYATDDGSFESQILRRATKERPANLRMTAIRDYAPCCNEELSVRKGQRVRVLYRNHDWVFAVTKHGSNGFLPYSYVRPSRKYSGYQSEPEFCRDDAYMSGYDTDATASQAYPPVFTHTRRPEVPPSYSINTGCRRVDSGSPVQTQVIDNSGYMSSIEGPTYHTSVSRVSRAYSNYRPATIKPPMDSFRRAYIEELVVIHDFEAKEENEVFVSKGQRVRVLNADDCNWLWVVTVHSGEEGFIPRTCCTLGNHPSLSSPVMRQGGRTARLQTMDAHRRNYHARHNIHHRNMRLQAKDRFRHLAMIKSSNQNPVTVDKEEIKKIGTRLIVLMDYEATVEEELTVEFSEPLLADVLGQSGSEKIWAYCPRTDKCGFIPMSLVVPPVV